MTDQQAVDTIKKMLPHMRVIFSSKVTQEEVLSAVGEIENIFAELDTKIIDDFGMEL